MDNQENNILKDFMIALYKIGLALKYENKPPDCEPQTIKSDSGRK